MAGHLCRGHRLQKGDVGSWFIKYSAIGFGGPLILTVNTAIFDRLVRMDMEESFKYRPGKYVKK